MTGDDQHAEGVDHAAAGPLDAGEFGAWLGEIDGALRGDGDADVPCGGCVACCSSSQFVHIGPDETDTLAHVPRALLFPAPRLPAGHVLMGYDERGCCPMLVDGGCSIYDHRPRTCRTYDCRVFPAAGVEQLDAGKEAIGQRARRWRFTYADDDASVAHAAVRAAARYVASRPEALPEGFAITTTAQLAVAAVEARHAFTTADPANGVGAVAPDPDPAAVRIALERRSRP